MSTSDTSLEQVFHEWLDAFNSGRRDRLEQFSDSRWPSGRDHLDHMLVMAGEASGLDLLRVEEIGGSRLRALVRERSWGSVVRVEMETLPGGRCALDKVHLWFHPTPPDMRPSRLSESQLAAELEAGLDRTGADVFSGSVAVARHGRIFCELSRGDRDRERAIPVDVETRFRVGSMNKMFTAVAVLQLVQEGALRLGDPLLIHIPDYTNRKLAGAVTIHHLLTHTGGTGDIFGPEFRAHRLSLRTHQDYLDLFGGRDLLFEPGARHEYSNYGFVLLGSVIEHVTGRSYYEVVAERVYGPASMSSTGSEPEDVQVSGRAVGYTRARPGRGWAIDLAPDTDLLPYRGTAAGGGYSTPRDLLRFADALIGRRLLNDDMTGLLLDGKVDGPSSRYAYGFEEQFDGGVRIIGHGGGAPGMNGELRILPESGYAVASLANLDPPAADRIASWIISRLPSD